MVMGFVVPYDVVSLSSIVFGSPDLEEGQSYTLALGAFEYQSASGLISKGSTFRIREEIATFDMTDYTVSEGYIGMNIGDDFGGFGGQRPDGDFGGRQNWDINPTPMFSALLSQASDVELPNGIVLPEDLSSEDAIQLMLYLLGNKIDEEELQELIEGSMFNGEFDYTMPPDGQFNPGNMPGGMPPGGNPPQGGPGGFGGN